MVCVLISLWNGSKREKAANELAMRFAIKKVYKDRFA